MSNNHKNINLNGNGFAEKLRTLREASRLSQSDLAKKAGLTYRTVHDLELGKRQRSQQKTLMLLAQALDVSLDDLVDGPEHAISAPPVHTSRRFPRGITISTAVLIVLAVAAGLLWRQSCAHATWTLDDRQFVVRDEILGTQLWEISGNERQIQSCMVSPWDSHRLLIWTNRHAPGGGRLLCLARASGDTIWSVGPDIQAMVRAFGAEMVMSADFSALRIQVANLDGDDTPEVIVSFVHGKYYPYAICIIRSDGTLRAQYANRGHLYGLVVADIDGDGKDEVIGVGTNNSQAYVGATVLMLDDKHCRGAAIDSLSAPGSSEPDSALIRTILPNYPAPYMSLIVGQRLGAHDPQVFTDNAGSKLISVAVRSENPMCKISVFLDSELRPVRADVDDSFLQYGISQWPDSLRNGVGPGDPQWLAAWLAGYKRFEMGILQAD